MPKDTKKEKAVKKGRAKKDPSAPKKPLSAFMFFSSKNRNRIKEENPGVSFGITGLTQVRLESCLVSNGKRLTRRKRKFLEFNISNMSRWQKRTRLGMRKIWQHTNPNLLLLKMTKRRMKMMNS
jgi:hypothetical protein